MLRSIGAVVVGYLVFGISAAFLFQLAHVDPHQRASTAFTIFSIAYGIGFALLAGWVAASIAVRRRLLHACIVAGILGAIALLSMFAQPASRWTHFAALFLFAPSVVAGGILKER